MTQDVGSEARYVRTAGTAVLWLGVALAAVGLIWLVTFFLSQNTLPAPYLGAWNTVWSFLLIVLGLVGIIAGVAMRRAGRPGSRSRS